MNEHDCVFMKNQETSDLVAYEPRDFSSHAVLPPPKLAFSVFFRPCWNDSQRHPSSTGDSAQW